ncbi:hypothetical protein PAPHI01_1448 [Pancytospora philotis]|nr:hypothetical protein PAPHI01_1448 [Pancytospora philotis]
MQFRSPFDIKGISAYPMFSLAIPVSALLCFMHAVMGANPSQADDSESLAYSLGNGLSLQPSPSGREALSSSSSSDGSVLAGDELDASSLKNLQQEFDKQVPAVYASCDAFQVSCRKQMASALLAHATQSFLKKEDGLENTDSGVSYVERGGAILESDHKAPLNNSVEGGFDLQSLQSITTGIRLMFDAYDGIMAEYCKRLYKARAGMGGNAAGRSNADPNLTKMAAKYYDSYSAFIRLSIGSSACYRNIMNASSLAEVDTKLFSDFYDAMGRHICSLRKAYYDREELCPNMFGCILPVLDGTEETEHDCENLRWEVEECTCSFIELRGYVHLAKDYDGVITRAAVALTKNLQEALGDSDNGKLNIAQIEAAVGRVIDDFLAEAKASCLGMDTAKADAAENGDDLSSEDSRCWASSDEAYEERSDAESSSSDSTYHHPE